MKTVFEYANITADRQLEALVHKKLEKLSMKHPSIIRSDIFFRKENKSDQKGCICGIQLSMPGPRMYASSDEKSFESAIHETVDDLNDQLQKRKVKLRRLQQVG